MALSCGLEMSSLSELGGGDFWLSIARWKRHSPNLKGA